MICLDNDTSSVDESPPDTSFCEVIGTTDNDFLVCLFTRIKDHGTICRQWFVNYITANKYLPSPSILCHELIQNRSTATMYIYICPALMHNTFNEEKCVFLNHFTWSPLKQDQFPVGIDNIRKLKNDDCGISGFRKLIFSKGFLSLVTPCWLHDNVLDFLVFHCSVESPHWYPIQLCYFWILWYVL